jgi:hypothetical protein
MKGIVLSLCDFTGNMTASRTMCSIRAITATRGRNGHACGVAADS